MPKQTEQLTRITKAEWHAEAERRFGKDPMKWKWICPICKHVQSMQDYKDAGAETENVAFSCVGRWIEGSKEAFKTKGKGPCTYAGGGLFRLNPITVVGEDGKEITAFAFADPDPKPLSLSEGATKDIQDAEDRKVLKSIEPKSEETPPCPTNPPS